jgi:hypothetical protein
MSRTTRTLALLWREWRDSESVKEFAAILCLTAVIVGMVYVVSFVVGLLAGLVIVIGDAPKAYVGFLALLAAALGWCIVDYILNAARALRHAWERAGREG